MLWRIIMFFDNDGCFLTTFSCNYDPVELNLDRLSPRNEFIMNQSANIKENVEPHLDLRHDFFPFR